MIISRYLNREVFNALLAVTLVLLLIFLSNQLVRYLSYAASGKLPATILFQLMGFEIPYLLALLLPLGLYLGIILGYGRLYADHEMSVLQACGFSTKRLLYTTAIPVVVIGLVVTLLMIEINPWIAAKKDELIAKSLSMEHVLDTLLPGRFQVSSDGERVAYVEQISRNRKMANNLFIAEQKTAPDSAQSRWVVVSASHGFQQMDPGTHDRFMVATDGFRYEGIPGQNDYKIIQFKKYAIRMGDAPVGMSRHAEESLPTLALFKTYHMPDHAAELQWRLSIPISVILLALLAIPLSHVRPRQGRYSSLLPAILIYVVYVNLLLITRSWIEQKSLPISLGLWWVHGLLLVFFVFFMWIQERYYNTRYRNP
jgi:lipopolysaccharide export system permease protein